MRNHLTHYKKHLQIIFYDENKRSKNEVDHEINFISIIENFASFISPTLFPLQRILQPLDLQLLVKKHNAIFLKELSSRFYSMQTKNFYAN